MAGRGPAPTDPNRRARRNADPSPLRIIPVTPTEQPSLPTLRIQRRVPKVLEGGKVGYTIELVRARWPQQTLDWWRMWAESPLSKEFTETDWSELRDTARLHALYWLGHTNVAAELRLRVAKFGATPEDRLRLKIMFAIADGSVSPTTGTASPASARERRGPLTSLG